MRRIVLSLILFLLPSLSAAEGGGKAAPVYVVDVQEVIQKSTVGRSAEEQIQEELASQQNELRSLKQELDGSEAKLQKQAGLLSQEAQQERQQTIAEQSKELRRKVQDYQESAQRLQQRTLAELVESIDETIEAVAVEEQLSLIVEKDPRWIIYINPEFEITERVVQSFEKREGRL